MLSLDRSMVRLGLNARDKEDAIRQVAAILADGGCIDGAYADSMLAREGQTATYLGNGIAIPHGLRGDGHLIHRTAIAVAQFPAGVDWGPGERVHLAVGIAAKSDEHIAVLARLTDVLQSEEDARRLATTADEDQILAALNAEPPPAPPAAARTAYDAYPVQEEVAVTAGTGLHARPATVFAGVAKGFRADIRVRHGPKVANAKAMASLLTLGVESGGVIRIMADGADAEAAVAALVDAVRGGLDEDEADAGAPGEAAMPPPGAPLPFKGDVRRGAAASPGIAIGRLHHLRPAELFVRDEAGAPEAETRALDAALDQARLDVKKLHAGVEARSGSRKAAILLAHLEFLDDPDLRQEAVDLIAKGRSAPRAWEIAALRRAAELEALADPLLQARAADVRDVCTRVLRALAGEPTVHDPLAALPAEPVVVAAHDLAPSETAGLGPERALAICTALGAPSSHTAILARGLGIPAVVGLGDGLDAIADGTRVVLDGDGGVLVVDPDADDEAVAARAMTERRAAAEAAQRDAYRPAFTTDGRRIEIAANIGAVEEAARAVEAGAEGVGLLRTEFLFLGRDDAPGEDEQFEAMHAMTTALNGLPLIVRTLDIGGDKEVPYLNLPREDNPFLGVRGVRLCLERRELFATQLRAIARTAAAAPPGAVKVMLPMIARRDELRECRRLLADALRAAGAPPVDLGIMVEVPAAALLADVLAADADFFSIGTNDLTQYTLAMDRLNPQLADHADALDPAVLRLIKQVVDAAHRHGRWVGICGNVAAEPTATAVLVGLGVDELSVSPPAVAELKARVRGLSAAAGRRLAERALAAPDAAAVRALR